ncbi:MAG: HDOD domain-containing protein [Pseudoalteromonas prydzensis]|uniref:HDOD domain-containing protein n=1 Tax=Pseudoalteromonas prydzensis TaxID=182141 RepID=A0A7V1CVV4_9GAMM|nr:HDOD domain-containing protein [Pseudoalteromonas prydzensis]HEA15286.1 HDOD domain-containing protein [Pseudoalteromonas prydzensis]
MTDEIRQQRTAKALEQRAHDLLLGHSFAQRQIGYIHTLDINYGEAIKQRTLLEVEVAAQKIRKLSSTSHHKYRAQASQQLHQVIDTAMNKQLADIDTVLHETIGIEDNVPAILDILAVKSASVGRLEPLVKDLTWLGRELVTFVNLPYYRAQRNKHTSVKVDNPALALRYIGLDNLQFVVPTFAVRHWMPHSTEPFPLLKRRLRDNSMACAIAAQELAKLNGINEVHAFTLGMLLDVGKIALIRLYLRTFERVWQRKVTLAREEQHKDLHTALLELKPDPLFLSTLLNQHALKVTATVIEKMAFRYLPFNAVLSQLVNGVAKGDSALPLTMLIRKARCYSQAVSLNAHQLLESDEKSLWFDYVGLAKQELEQLEKTNLQHFHIKID